MAVTTNRSQSKNRQGRMELSGADLKDVGPIPKLQRIIECPVCQGVPFPPIYNCAKGHIICGTCRPGFKICGLCRSNYTGSRNFMLEDIVMASKFSCEFKDQGCTAVVDGHKLRDHVKNCDYGPIECLGGPTCKTILGFKTYAEHLKLHGVTIIGTANYYCKSVSDQIDITFTDNFRYCKLLSSVWSAQFVLHAYLKEGVLNFHVLLIGLEKDASKYHAEWKFHNQQQKLFYGVTIAVMPIKNAGMLGLNHQYLPGTLSASQYMRLGTENGKLVKLKYDLSITQRPNSD